MSGEPPDVAGSLGRAHAQWEALLAFVDTQSGVRRQWKRYPGAHGWQLKLMTARRALAYLMPREGHFVVALALRGPAIAALRAGGVPDDVVRAIEAAREAPEGRPARVEVRTPRDRALAEQLLAVKLAAG